MIERQPAMVPQLGSLLRSEIYRVKESAVLRRPDEPHPLTLDQYRRIFADKIALFRPVQVKNFLYAIRDDAAEISRNAPAGSKILPVLMLTDHGGFPFDPVRINTFGNLYYYVVTGDNLAVRADAPAYLDAVFPPEILALAVPLPVNILDPEQSGEFFLQLKRNVDKLLGFLK